MIQMEKATRSTNAGVEAQRLGVQAKAIDRNSAWHFQDTNQESPVG